MTIRTKLSHSSKEKDVNGWLEGKISNQLKVEKPYFRKMIECPITREQYYSDMQALAEQMVRERHNANEGKKSDNNRQAKRNKRNRRR